jgi:hypothetical protein
LVAFGFEGKPSKPFLGDRPHCLRAGVTFITRRSGHMRLGFAAT